MAYEGPAVLNLLGAVAGAGLTDATAQYKFVKLSAERTVVLCDAITDIPCGVLQEPAYATGQAVNVLVTGISKVRAAVSASLAAGQMIGTDGDGQAAVYAVTDTSVYVAGQIIEVAGAAASGDLITASLDLSAPVRFA